MGEAFFQKFQLPDGSSQTPLLALIEVFTKHQELSWLIQWLRPYFAPFPALFNKVFQAKTLKGTPWISDVLCHLIKRQPIEDLYVKKVSEEIILTLKNFTEDAFIAFNQLDNWALMISLANLPFSERGSLFNLIKSLSANSRAALFAVRTGHTLLLLNLFSNQYHLKLEMLNDFFQGMEQKTITQLLMTAVDQITVFEKMIESVRPGANYEKMNLNFLISFYDDLDENIKNIFNRYRTDSQNPSAEKWKLFFEMIDRKRIIPTLPVKKNSVISYKSRKKFHSRPCTRRIRRSSGGPSTPSNTSCAPPRPWCPGPRAEDARLEAAPWQSAIPGPVPRREQPIRHPTPLSADRLSEAAQGIIACSSGGGWLPQICLQYAHSQS